MFKTQKDYESLTIDSFPFLYFMISKRILIQVRVTNKQLKYLYKSFRTNSSCSCM